MPVVASSLYASYDWPSGGAASPDMEVDVEWTTIPDGTNSDGNGVFASSQYWYESYGQVRAPQRALCGAVRGRLMKTPLLPPPAPPPHTQQHTPQATHPHIYHH